MIVKVGTEAVITSKDKYIREITKIKWTGKWRKSTTVSLKQSSLGEVKNKWDASEKIIINF